MNESSVFESFDGPLRLSSSPEKIDNVTVASSQKIMKNSKEIIDNYPGVIKNPIYKNQNLCQPIVDFPRDKTGGKR